MASFQKNSVPLKVQKRNQIAELLISKFKNKYQVNAQLEPEIDMLINEQVNNLLSQGESYETQLSKVDKRLAELIVQERHASANQQAQRSEVGSMRSGQQPDMMSQRSQVSQRPRVYHTDPAKDLNPTEDQWNAIVMANFEKHKQEKLSVKKNALEKTKKIQEEQIRQMQIRKEMEDFQDKERKDQFQKQGIKASDIYYINQDARNNMLQQYKQTGPTLGKEHDLIYQSRQQTKKEMLKREAFEREDKNMRQAAEDQVARQHQLQRKKVLAEQQMQDQQAKYAYRNHIDSSLKSKNDFNDQNVLTYLYEQKEHKSWDLRKKNEHVQSFIKDQLPNTVKRDLTEAERIDTYQSMKVKEFDDEQARRKNERKQKEMEIKAFQDQQVQEKMSKKDNAKQIKLNEFNYINEQAVKYEEEGRKREQERKLRNIHHIEQVRELQKEEPRTFAKTGIAIIKS